MLKTGAKTHDSMQIVCIMTNIPSYMQPKHHTTKFSSYPKMNAKTHAAFNMLQCLLFGRYCLSSTIRNGQSRFQIPPRIHQAPKLLPILTWRIKACLPRLIKCFEPKVFRAVSLKHWELDDGDSHFMAGLNSPKPGIQRYP